MLDINTWERRKKQIEKQKADNAKNKGARETMLAQVSKEYGCDSVETARVHHTELIDKKVKVDEKLENVLEELEAYDWD